MTHPESAPAAGAELEAWALDEASGYDSKARTARESGFLGQREDQAAANLRALAVLARIPAPPAEAQGLRTAMREACDLLQERTHGSPARSPGHNARLVLESALSAPPRDAEAGGGVRVPATFAGLPVVIDPSLKEGEWRLQPAPTPPPGPAVEDAAGEALALVRELCLARPGASWIATVADIERLQIERGLRDDFTNGRDLSFDQQRARAAPYAPAPGAGVPADGAESGLTADRLRRALTVERGLVRGNVLLDARAQTDMLVDLLGREAARRSTPPAQDTPEDSIGKPTMPAHDYAEQWASDTLSGRSDGERFTWGERNLATAYLEQRGRLSVHQGRLTIRDPAQVTPSAGGGLTPAQAVREEIVRQFREDERGKCPAGAAWYEEHVAPGLIATAALAHARSAEPGARPAYAGDVREGGEA